MGELGHPVSDDDIADRLRWFSRSGADHVLTAISDAEAVGLLTLSVIPRFVVAGRFARITTLAVPHDRAHERIDRALIAEAESLAGRHSCTGVEVITTRRSDGEIDGPFLALDYVVADEHEVRCEKTLIPSATVRI